MTTKKEGPQKIGNLTGNRMMQAQKNSSLVPAREARKPSKIITPDGGIITPQTGKLIEAAAEIAMLPPEDMAFTHAVLCQVGLPRAKVDGREFMRQSGAAWVNIQAGWLDEGSGPVLQPIPYGVMPRLALAWVSTYAVRNKEREIRIGDSAAEFLSLMGLDDQGARYATLRKQMHALAACRLQLGVGARIVRLASVSWSG